MAAVTACLLVAACTRAKAHVAPPLPVNATGPTVCGQTIPRAVAEMLAGTTNLSLSGTLVPGRAGDCGVFRADAPTKLVFKVSVQASLDNAAAHAYVAVAGTMPPQVGYRLPPAEGYGIVGKSTIGTSGRSAFGITASGDVKIDVTVLYDAKGRDPVADARALLNLLGPKLAPQWPKPPAGIDPLQPNSPPPGVPTVNRTFR